MRPSDGLNLPLVAPHVSRSRSLWLTLAGALLATASSGAYAAFGLADFTSLSAEAAATNKAAIKPGWQGSMSLGYVGTTGNSNTRSLDAKAQAAYRSDAWANLLSAQLLRASANGVTSADSLDAAGQSDYNLTPTNYLFGSLSYLRNTFAGYRHRNSEIIGYGRRLVDSASQRLDVELGVGARQERLTDNTSTSEFVQRLGATYLWEFSKKSNFSETLGVEHGASNTFVQSVTALTTNLVDSFALSVSYTVNHNTQPQPTFKPTDTITSVSLIYTF